MNPRYKKILIIHTAFIGDVILLTPLIKAIKKCFPDSQIDVLVVPACKNILENNPNINTILTFDKENRKISSFFKIFGKLRETKYDIAFLAHSSLTTALLTFLGKIPERIGFDRWLARYFLTKKVKFRKNIFRIQKNLDLIRAISNEKFEQQTELFSNNTIKNKISKLVNPYKNKKLIAVAPGSIWFTKRWPEEYYHILCKKLAEQDYFLFLVGSPDENEICEKIKPDKNAIVVAGKLTILESAELIKRCELMICNDSGALHLANAVKTDVSAIFGPTVKGNGYFPFRENDFIFEVDLPCRPCGSHGSKKCPKGHHKCMRLIKPKIILGKILSRFMENYEIEISHEVHKEAPRYKNT